MLGDRQPTSTRFRDLETIRDPDGVIAVITENVETQALSYRIQKEFTHRGQVKVTSYLSQSHLPAIRRVLVELEERLRFLRSRPRPV